MTVPKTLLAGYSKEVCSFKIKTKSFLIRIYLSLIPVPFVDLLSKLCYSH